MKRGRSPFRDLVCVKRAASPVFCNALTPPVRADQAARASTLTPGSRHRWVKFLGPPAQLAARSPLSPSAALLPAFEPRPHNRCRLRRGAQPTRSAGRGRARSRDRWSSHRLGPRTRTEPRPRTDAHPGQHVRPRPTPRASPRRAKRRPELARWPSLGLSLKATGRSVAKGIQPPMGPALRGRLRPNRLWRRRGQARPRTALIHGAAVG
jgi:hypothetical protein